MKTIKGTLILGMLLITTACGTAQMAVREVADLRPDLIPLVGTNNQLGVVSLKSSIIPEEVYGVYVNEMEKKASDRFSAKSFFNVTGIGSDEARTMTSMKQYSEIAKKYNINTLFVMNQPNKIPTIDCRLHAETRYRNGACSKSIQEYKRRDNGTGYYETKCEAYEQVPYQVLTSVLSYSGQIKGELINLTNGKKISILSDPVSQESLDGAVCNGDHAGVKNRWAGRAANHAESMADKISPRIGQIHVPIFSGTDGIVESPSNKDQIPEIKKELKRSLKLAEKGSVEEAATIWKKVEELSQNKSSVSSWNLAVYFWSIGDIKQSKKYSDKSLSLASDGMKEKIKSYKTKIDEQYNLLR